MSLNDAIRQAIQELIDRKRGDGDLAAQAAKALEEMEQEAATRRQALQALLGPTAADRRAPPADEQPTPTRGRPRRGEPTS